MNAIGGYFELELLHGEEYHKNAIKINTGRNAFEYVLMVKGYQKVYLPYYTCDVMLEPIKNLHLDFEFYNIDKTFRPVFNFDSVQENEVFIYNNYYGICNEQVLEVTNQCKNIVIDNSQAFFSLPLHGIDTFYSPRKFFGLPDGAYLYTDSLLDYDLEQDVSYDRCTHLLGRIDNGAENHFESFKNNSNVLANQPIKKMSNLTRRLLQAIDYKSIADRRKENFNYLHKTLKDLNDLKLNIGEDEVPMVYPFLTHNGNLFKKKLIENKIFVATYWPNVLECVKSGFEYELANNLICFPIDQRYNKFEINKVLKLLWSLK